MSLKCVSPIALMKLKFSHEFLMLFVMLPLVYGRRYAGLPLGSIWPCFSYTNMLLTMLIRGDTHYLSSTALACIEETGG
jgi:hypothetical protein